MLDVIDSHFGCATVERVCTGNISIYPAYCSGNGPGEISFSYLGSKQEGYSARYSGFNTLTHIVVGWEKGKSRLQPFQTGCRGRRSAVIGEAIVILGTLVIFDLTLEYAFTDLDGVVYQQSPRYRKRSLIFEGE